uniref:Reverse transcriptase zinc-binding domain-containing protein n=1 Tax=Cajanus cajan TaxID=3821 RepID=A0A151RAU8_CAJCA|nr:hypothetical protein KK1_039086 [Cajanus cajan]
MRLGLSKNNLCCLCEEHEESLFHLFRDCTEVRLIWQFFIQIDNAGDFHACNH